ncbi:NlpC/P60 family protein [Mycolicibacterium arabiense]|uniref:NlpC/P60 family protein n=1 Tax=Mycolicibacterium arabiense TaxID=1286181 RepID=UPI001F32ECBF|nr:NlpC/P60 family protein [Mycolicibacterium arabiense]
MLVGGCAALLDADHVAHAEPAGSTVDLVVQVAESEQRLHDLGASIQQRQEEVNRAIADVGSARDTAAEAGRRVAESAAAVSSARSAIDEAQRRFDRFAASTYVHGPSASYLAAGSPDDLIAAATAAQALPVAYTQTLTALRRSRTEAANEESAARSAQRESDAAAVEAVQSQADAVAALTSTQRDFAAEHDEVAALTARRDAARTRLAAQPTAGHADWDVVAETDHPAARADQWDTTLPMVPSANVSTDPLAVVNSVLQIASTSAQTTANLGRSFLARLGINLGGVSGADGSGITNGAIPRVYGRQAAEYVIQRATSQIGVSYSWGGGNASGPSRGIDSGSRTVGFDCSGIVLYAFAGVGIKLPHYSGDQYRAGRMVPSSQMRRGDVIFYGPNASQHEALYLGQGMMLEAPFTGSDVHVSPVRTSGMTPYVTRFIEY